MTPLSANTDGSAARDPQSYAIIGAQEIGRREGIRITAVARAENPEGL